MRKGDPEDNYNQDKETYKGLGQIIYALEELDKSSEPRFFADDFYKNLKRISHFRNFYCHECALKFAYENSFPNPNFNEVFDSLKKDHAELLNIFNGLEKVKHRVINMYRRS